MSDKVIEQLKEKFDERSLKGISKYSTTLGENLDDNYVKHALEESMDMCGYLMAFRNQMMELCSRHANDQELGAKIREVYGA